jgi:hypothetical protein
MRILLIIMCIGSLSGQLPAFADDGSVLTYEFAIGIEKSDLDDLSLGFVADPGDPDLQRLEEEDLEFEFDLEYQVNDQLYFFFTGAFIDETESVEPDGERDHVSGLERKEIGIGIFFGEEIQSELNIGRMEFTSISEWWLWWDEELDAIRLESSFGRFETLLGIAEEQARESTGVDFIDPEIDGIRRIIASLSWEIDDHQSLYFYYLDQEDNSDTFYRGFGSFEDCNDGPPAPACEFEEFDRIDSSSCITLMSAATRSFTISAIRIKPICPRSAAGRRIASAARHGASCSTGRRQHSRTGRLSSARPGVRATVIRETTG